MSNTNSISYSLCIKKLYPTMTADDFSLEQDEEGLRLNWLNEAFGSKPTFETLATQWLQICKDQAILDVKDIRKQGLNLAVESSGILAVYLANYEAASEFLAGRPDTILKTGVTAVSDLTLFGSKLHTTGAQFASY